MQNIGPKRDVRFFGAHNKARSAGSQFQFPMHVTPTRVMQKITADQNSNGLVFQNFQSAVQRSRFVHGPAGNPGDFTKGCPDFPLSVREQYCKRRARKRRRQSGSNVRNGWLSTGHRSLKLTGRAQYRNWENHWNAGPPELSTGKAMLDGIFRQLGYCMNTQLSHDPVFVKLDGFV